MIAANPTPALLALFRMYTRRYLARNFHAVHLFGEIPAFPHLQEKLPLLVCLNHSSWWDVMLGIFVAGDVLGGENYSVMDARQLQRYKFFARLGIIGVDRTSLAGAREFVEYASGLLVRQPRALWITPQGAMFSNLSRPLHFQPGIGHLAERLGDFYVTTITFHYEFWNEKLPEAFVAIGPPERISIGSDFSRRAFVHAQERRLETQMDLLLAVVQSREPAFFHSLLRGRIGISPVYDTIRATAARARGERFSAEHGDTVTQKWNEEHLEPQSHADTADPQSKEE